MGSNGPPPVHWPAHPRPAGGAARRLWDEAALELQEAGWEWRRLNPEPTIWSELAVLCRWGGWYGCELMVLLGCCVGSCVVVYLMLWAALAAVEAMPMPDMPAPARSSHVEVPYT